MCAMGSNPVRLNLPSASSTTFGFVMPSHPEAMCEYDWDIQFYESVDDKPSEISVAVNVDIHMSSFSIVEQKFQIWFGCDSFVE